MSNPGYVILKDTSMVSLTGEPLIVVMGSTAPPADSFKGSAPVAWFNTSTQELKFKDDDDWV